MASVFLASIDVRIHPEARWEYPSWTHALGTDNLGRDVLGLTILGWRNSLIDAGIVAAGAVVVGLFLGLSSGYWSGSIGDSLLSGAAEFINAVPGLLVLLVMIGLRIDLRVGFIALAWIEVWRIGRSATVVEFGAPYLCAAIALGASPSRILFRYLLPAVGARIREIIGYQYIWILTLLSMSELFNVQLRIDRPTVGTLLNGAFRLSIEQYRLWLPSVLVLCLMNLAIQRRVVRSVR